jgi:DNA polymerase-3 subunit alpha
MPDIDSDFCYERRGEVIDYVVKKYGESNVSQIITFGTMAARACIRDVGRAMNYTYAEVDKIAKMIPAAPNMTIDKALEINPELKEIYEDDERIKELIDVSKSLEGLPRHTSTHAAGVVIASEPLVNFVPLQRNEDNIVSQFTMNTLEELGLLKMDFLGLRTLTVMRDAVRFIKENRGIDIDLDHINYEDSEVYKMIGDGKTVGVFQLESQGMTTFMKELKPDKLEDIIAGISLYRPGPMAEIPRYIENKNNPSLIKYDPPELEHILDVTYGCMVYQEQVMQIVRDLAGYSMGRSDLVRRAMSKKKHKVMEEERKNFIYGIVDENDKVIVPGCIRNGISEESASRIFDSMMDFASYAFNKSHAAAYAVVGFQTAYLVHYYPVEFIAAMLNSNLGNNDKIAYYIRFADSLGIKVLPPDINESFTKFTVKGNTIRFGLAAIKNAGENMLDSIVKSRSEKGKFKDLGDFCSKIDTNCINKRVVESLIKAGAFDCFKVYRSRLLAVYEKVLDGMSNDRKRNIDGQMNLFMDFSSTSNQIEIEYPNVNEFEKKYLLAMEKEMTGLYLSGHPLEEYKSVLDMETNTKISDIISEESLEDDQVESVYRVKDGDRVVIGGIITETTKKITKKNDMMAFVKLEDLYGTIEVIIFPKHFEKYKSLITNDALVIITGRVSMREEEQPKVICEGMKPISKVKSEKVYIQMNDTDTINKAMAELKPLLMEHKGSTPVYLFSKKERNTFRLARELWIDSEEEIIETLRKKFGSVNVKVV